MTKRGIIEGCLIGGAAGEAYAEYFRRESVPFNNTGWNFSDATRLTQATCEAILEQGLINPDAIQAKFNKWYKAGLLSGSSGSAMIALRAFSAGKENLLSADHEAEHLSNGAAVRMAPLAFFLDPHQENDNQTIREICNITHSGDEGIAGSLAVIHVIRLITNQQQSALQRLVQLIPASKVKEKLLMLLNHPLDSIRHASALSGSGGYAWESIPLSIFAALHAPEKGYLPMIRELVECGGDITSNCSLAGQMAGAALGKAGIPGETIDMLKSIPEAEEVLEVFREFARFAEKQSGIQTLF